MIIWEANLAFKVVLFEFVLKLGYSAATSSEIYKGSGDSPNESEGV
jgi:hypothetical protein